MVSSPVEKAVISRKWSGAMPSDVKAPELTLATRQNAGGKVSTF
ncbi:hypothetical protein [Roseovarius sp.]